MDDHKISVPIHRCVMRQCEASRLQEQLLARAYQQVFPQARQPLPQAKVPASRVGGRSSHKAAVAAGA
jgi:hypothetical protein